MSYSQILRRLSRVLKSTVNDVIDNISQEAKDLNDFDEELRRPAREERTAGQQSGGQSGRSSSGQGDGGGQRAGQQKKSGSTHQEGRRKPGERDDAYYYGILGLTPDASVEQIRKTYRKLMGQYHPDRVASLGADKQAAAVEKAKVINEAYQIIERRRGMR